MGYKYMFIQYKVLNFFFFWVEILTLKIVLKNHKYMYAYV